MRMKSDTDVAIEVLESLKEEYPEHSDEYADISQTIHYLINQ